MLNKPLALTREQRKALDTTVLKDDAQGREQSFLSVEPEASALSHTGATLVPVLARG